MSEQKTDIPEQRRDDRRPAKPGAFAVLHFSPAKIVQIADIANGGIGFFHVSKGKWPRKPFQIDLLFDDERFNREKLQILSIAQCKLVFEAATPGNDMVRRGIQFGKLSPELDSRLKRYTDAITAQKEEISHLFSSQ